MGEKGFKQKKCDELWSVCKNLDLGHVYRPHCVQSELTTSAKIFPYRSIPRLIRGKTKVINKIERK